VKKANRKAVRNWELKGETSLSGGMRRNLAILCVRGRKSDDATGRMKKKVAYQMDTVNKTGTG